MKKSVFAILLALLLAKWFTDTRLKLRGQGAIKVMVYMPNIITAASISVLFSISFPPVGSFSAIVQLKKAEVNGGWKM